MHARWKLESRDSFSHTTSLRSEHAFGGSSDDDFERSLCLVPRGSAKSPRRTEPHTLPSDQSDEGLAVCSVDRIMASPTKMHMSQDHDIVSLEELVKWLDDQKDEDASSPPNTSRRIRNRLSAQRSRNRKRFEAERLVLEARILSSEMKLIESSLC